MSLVLAAIGAVLTALIELSFLPHFRVEGAHPHPVFVAGVIVAIAVGFEAGLVWAFVGGLALDVLAARPLGSTTFALLVSIAGAWAIGRVMGRFRAIAPIVAVALLGFIYSLIQFALLNALTTPVPVEDPVSILVPGAIYDVLLAAVFGPIAVILHDRRVADEDDER